MKQIGAWLIILFFFPLVLSAQRGKTIDKIVAIVGNEIITQSELDVQLLRMSMRSKMDLEDPVLRRRVLDEMINNKLILAQAILDSVNVSDEMVIAQVNEQIRMLEQNYGSTENLERAAGMTVGQLRREFREDVRKRLMIESLQREKFGTISVTSREVEEFFRAYSDSLPQIPEEVRLRILTIFPRITEDFFAATRAKAVEVLDSLRAGADFAETARRHSDDVGTARNGGDLGLARRGLFVKEFEEAAFALQPGELSGIVQTKFGFHIIKLLERKGEAIRVAHILFRVEKTGESDAAAIDSLRRLRRRALSGEEFEMLARQFSEDQATRSLGGDMGLMEISSLSPELKTVQQSLNPGEISEPTRISLDRDYAFALVQLVQRVPPHTANLKDDYQRVMNFARIYKQNRLYLEWLDQIRQNVYWKVNL